MNYFKRFFLICEICEICGSNFLVAAEGRDVQSVVFFIGARDGGSNIFMRTPGNNGQEWIKKVEKVT